MASAPGQAQLCEWMERDRPDVVCLQELKAEVSADPRELQEFSPTITCTGTACPRVLGRVAAYS